MIFIPIIKIFNLCNIEITGLLHKIKITKDATVYFGF